jgi:hypothetical protein
VGPAALFGLLGHALADLGGQVRRVELGHQRVDALGKAALGAVLQRLDHADQLDPEAAEQGSDGDVVFEVAGEPVHLVDDHHLDVWLLSGGRRRGASGADRSGARCGARHPARSYLCLRKAVNTVVPAQAVQSDQQLEEQTPGIRLRPDTHPIRKPQVPRCVRINWEKATARTSSVSTAVSRYGTTSQKRRREGYARSSPPTRILTGHAHQGDPRGPNKHAAAQVNQYVYARCRLELGRSQFLSFNPPVCRDCS